MSETDDVAFTTSQKAKVQQDWDDRELVEVVQLNIQKIASFLHHFDQTMKYKLGNLNSKLNKLERAVDYCEASIHTSLQISTADVDDL
mmetsp:Transcript_3729/g.3865  ORF Transcript_3729/g.3865 Transcript_3729/m.3865 type:complete len:88 (+) Transcript_3729:154-417(+)